jgi:hypothetical protein
MFTVTLTRQSLIWNHNRLSCLWFCFDVPAVKQSSTIYKITFTKPETIDFRYITDGNAQTTQVMILLMVMVDFVVKSA